MLFLVEHFMVKKEMCDGALSLYNNQFFCRQSSGRSLRTCSHNHRKASQQYAELTVWPARVNSL
jgi:hypothetical protein